MYVALIKIYQQNIFRHSVYVWQPCLDRQVRFLCGHIFGDSVVAYIILCKVNWSCILERFYCQHRKIALSSLKELVQYI
jgi:hypothetical protein